MTPGTIIRTLRRERGLSQVELATALGWGRSTLANIERDNDRPGMELVQALATFFSTTTDHILGRDGTKSPNRAQTDEEAELLARWRDAGVEAQQAILSVARAVTKARQ